MLTKRKSLKITLFNQILQRSDDTLETRSRRFSLNFFKKLTTDDLTIHFCKNNKLKP